MMMPVLGKIHPKGGEMAGTPLSTAKTHFLSFKGTEIRHYALKTELLLILKRKKKKYSITNDSGFGSNGKILRE